MKKVLLLAAAVLTLGTATAHLGLNGTFGKPVSKALHKVVESVKLNTADVHEMKASKAELVGSVYESKCAKTSLQTVNGLATPMVQMFTAEKLSVSPAKAAIAKQLAAKAPAAMNQTYEGNCQYYQSSAWHVAEPWTMTTISAGGADYMFDVIPDLAGFGTQISYYADGVFVQYTSQDNGDGTTAISIAPQYIASTAQYDIFLCDRSDALHGGDGTIKMTLAADGTLTVDNPTNIVGYFATPINSENPSDAEPPFVAANVAGAFEQCGLIEYSEPVPDTFVAETTYTGKGYDLGEKQTATWEMQIGTKNGVPVIRDLVPSISGDTGMPLDVTYTESGDKIIIQPQNVGMVYNAYYLYIFDWDSADGSITLTKDAQGHIVTPENLAIVIGAFKTDAFSDVSSDDYAGYWTRTEDVKYYAAGQDIPVPAPVAMYEPGYTALHIGLSSNIYQLQNTISLLPGYAEIPYVNTTKDEATSWSWEVCDSIDNETNTGSVAGTSKFTGTDKQFSFMTQGSAIFGTPVLTALNGELVSAPYVWGVNAEDPARHVYQYVGASIDSYTDPVGGTYTATVCNPGNEVAYYGGFATPDLNTNNANISTIYMYQGKPAAPLYITGLNLFVRQLTVQPGFTLTARIVEARRSASGGLTFGETIAYADASADDIVTTEGMSFINFNDMYVIDEDEMSESIDHLFLDKEFAVVIDDWNNGTFSCYPYGEYNYNENGFTNTLFEKEGEPGSLYRYTNQYTHLCLGFNGATYGYLHTADNANFTVLATGGEEKIRIDDAMYYSVGDNDAKSPYFSVSDDCPEWVTVEAENPNEDCTAFDLKFTFAENDGEARKATFYVWQEGAKIDVTVDQAGTINTGISAITAEGAANGPRYNVAGQRVNASAKGIVISNGKKQIAK